MKTKVLAIFLAILHYGACAGTLRRTPKVYNALITTDDNLTPSRAFPVIQPTIHETGIASYPFGAYNPYRFYSQPLLRFGQPYPQLQYPQIYNPQNLPPPVPEQVGVQANDLAPTLQQQPQPPSGPSGPGFTNMMELLGNGNPQEPVTRPNERPPIPLNQFGLPPNLVPLQGYPQQQPNPIYLPPYPYPNYPIVQDGFHRFQDPYLPPYGYYPPNNAFGIRPPQQQQPSKKYPGNQNRGPSTDYPGPENMEQEYEEVDENQTAQPTNIKNIKNGHKNSHIPDVPPPPIPSGGKNHKKPSQKS